MSSNIRLTNGAYVHESMVNVTMISLSALIEREPIAFYELTAKCRNPEHKFFGTTNDILRKWALLESGDKVQSVVKDIVLCAVKGEGFKLRLTSPIDINFKSMEIAKKEEESKIEGEIIPFDESHLEFWIDYFKTVNSIASHILNVMKKYNMGRVERLSEVIFNGPNPYYNQIVANGGLILEVNNGIPCCFWTPLGKYAFEGGGGSYKKEIVFDEIRESIKMFERDRRVDQYGNVTELYAIKEVKLKNEEVVALVQRKFPEPVRLSSKAEFTSYEICKDFWNKVQKPLIPKPKGTKYRSNMSLEDRVAECVKSYRLSFVGSSSHNFNIDSIGVFSYSPNLKMEGDINWDPEKVEQPGYMVQQFSLRKKIAKREEHVNRLSKQISANHKGKTWRRKKASLVLQRQLHERDISVMKSQLDMKAFKNTVKNWKLNPVIEYISHSIKMGDSKEIRRRVDQLYDFTKSWKDKLITV